MEIQMTTWFKHGSHLSENYPFIYNKSTIADAKFHTGQKSTH